MLTSENNEVEIGTQNLISLQSGFAKDERIAGMICKFCLQMLQQHPHVIGLSDDELAEIDEFLFGEINDSKS